jgi:hypothetical protein
MTTGSALRRSFRSLRLRRLLAGAGAICAAVHSRAHPHGGNTRVPLLDKGEYHGPSN